MKISTMFENISTREIALLCWLVILLVYLIFNKSIRPSFIRVIRAFFVKQLFVAFIVLILYTLGIIYIFHEIGLWDYTLTKDTCFWLFFSGLILFVNIKQIEDANYFKRIILDNVKAFVVIEYLINFYTFSLILELILLPLFTFLIALQCYANNSLEPTKINIKVRTFLDIILSILGISILGFTIYKIITEYNVLLTIESLKSFLLPLLLTIFTLPYFYFLALYAEYESTFIIINQFFRGKDRKVICSLKWRILFLANLRYFRLKEIENNLSFVPYPENDIKGYIKKITATIPKTTSSKSKVKIELFNHIDKVKKVLSQSGIGKLGKWNIYEEDFFSVSTYYLYPIEIGAVPNTMMYNLCGKTDHIEKLELILNLNNLVNNETTKNKFREIAELTFSCLSLRIPKGLIQTIIDGKNYEYANEIFITTLKIEKYASMHTWTLSIITK